MYSQRNKKNNVSGKSYANDAQESYDSKKNDMNYFRKANAKNRRTNPYNDMSTPERVANMIIGVGHGLGKEVMKSKNIKTMGKNLYKTKPKVDYGR
tara:strand:- start:1 stop:288 length:288 start_codon:yes stop_codon:yes gene_type:complete